MNKMKVIAIIMIVGLLLTVPTSVYASSPDIDIIEIVGDGHWSGDNWHLELYPGETAQAEITFKNRTDETLEVELDALYSRSNDNIDVWWDYREFDIKSGRTKDRTLFVEVLRDAAPGDYEFEFEVVWEAYKTKTVATQVVYKPVECKPVTIYKTATSWELPPEATIIYQYPVSYPPESIPIGLTGIDVLFWISVYVIGIGFVVTVAYLVFKRRKLDKDS